MDAAPTRDRLVDTTARLISRHGFAATGLKSIVTASDATFGSLYHYFPAGKEELGAAALRVSGEGYLRLVEAYFPDGVEVVAATRAFFDGAAALVDATDYEDACPIATVALEVASTSEPMRRAAEDAFDSWLDVLRRRFAEAGMTPEPAATTAVQCFCLIEGAFLLARTTRNAAPLRQAGDAAVALVTAALG